MRDPNPTRRSLGETLTRSMGTMPLSELARRLPNKKGTVGITRQALLELLGTTCPQCKGTGQFGGGECDRCGGHGKVWEANPTLDRLENYAELLGGVFEILLVYPPDHPLAGQVITGMAPGLVDPPEGRTG